MLSKRSIRGQFAKQIIFASLALIALFSFILYGFIKSYIFDELKTDLQKEAESIASSNTVYPIGTSIRAYSLGSLTSGNTLIEILPINKETPEIEYRMIDDGRSTFYQVRFPYKIAESSYIIITKDISAITKLLNNILTSILITNFAAFIIIQLYAHTLSNILILPISAISKKLSKMNESNFGRIDVSKIPKEFEPLGNSLNSLFDKLSNYLRYQKELFIGIAHELKTPLAVMKLKNEVALIKDRDIEKYKETLKLNIETINQLNSMISQILEIGRQEGAQFEPLKEIDLMSFLQERVEDFKLLARDEHKLLEANLEPERLMVLTQPTLFNHIVQNFLQNAIKFTKKGGKVVANSHCKDSVFVFEVIDEGCGIDGDIDVYAPFKKVGDKSGAGLGLFLAKNAADTLGIDIELKNRDDGVVGAVASIRVELLKQKGKKPFEIKKRS
ncbi:MAG: sensor histidine kinase [Campylobacterales bacterium]